MHGICRFQFLITTMCGALTTISNNKNIKNNSHYLIGIYNESDKDIVMIIL